MCLECEILNLSERAGWGVSVSWPDHAGIIVGSCLLKLVFYRRNQILNLHELAFFEEVSQNSWPSAAATL